MAFKGDCGFCDKVGRRAVDLLIAANVGANDGPLIEALGAGFAERPKLGTARDWLRRHRAAEKSRATDDTTAVAEVPEPSVGVVRRRAPREGTAAWQALTERAISLGDTAIASLEDKIEALPAKEQMQAAKLGLVASRTYADWVGRGRQLDQVDQLMRIASGATRVDPEIVEGTAVELPAATEGQGEPS